MKISTRRKHQEQPKEKTQIPRRSKEDQEQPKRNSDPKTQKLPEIIQGGEPRKPKTCRARR